MNFTLRSDRVRLSARVAILGTTAIIGLGLANPAAAQQTLTWDTVEDGDGSAGSGTVTGGSGTWDNDNSNDTWTIDGGDNNTDFDDGDNVIFGDTGGTVTVDDDPDALSMTFEVDGYTIQGDVIDNSGPNETDITANGDAEISSTLDGDFNVLSGTSTLTVSGTQNQIDTFDIQSGGTLSFSGSTDDGDFTVDAGGTLNVTGEIDDLDNSGTTNVDGGTIDKDAANNAGGTLNFDGTNTIESITNEGDMNVLTGTTSTTTNDGVTNQAGGTLDISDGATLEVDTGVTNTGTGSITTVDGELDGDVDNGTDAQLTVNSTGDVTGTMTNTADFDLNTGTVGAVDNNTGGDFDVTSGGFVDTTIDNAGDMDVNSGTLTVGGLTTNESGGTLTIDSGAFLDGDVTNDAGGTLDVDGQINGGTNAPNTVINNGSMTLSGTIAGDLTNSDTEDATVGLTVDGASTITQTFTNSGDAVISSTLTVTGGTSNEAGGDLDVSADLTTNLTNTGTDTDLQLDAILDGTLTNEDEATANVSGTGEVTGLTTVDDGTLNSAGTLAAIDSNGGETNVTGGTTGAITNDDGDVNISGGNVASVDNNLGTTDITGTGQVDGGVTVDDGTVTNSGGTIVGTTQVNDGIFNTSATTGEIDSNGGETNVTGGTTGAITNDDGDVNISGGNVASVDNNLGTTDITGTGQVDGGVTVDDGTVTNSGGTIVGTTQVNDGIFNTSATTGEIDSNGGETNVTGGTTGAITNDGGDITASAGTMDSIDNNSGTVDLQSGSSVTNDVDNAGDLTLSGGGIGGALTNEATGTVDVTAVTAVTGAIMHQNTAAAAFTVGADLSYSGFTNNGVVDLNGATLSGGTFTNNETLDMADGSAVNGAVISSGTIIGDGNFSFGSSLTSSGAVNMADGDTDDVMTISGTAALDGTTFDMDAELSGGAFSTDSIVINTPGATGSVVLAFDVTSDGGGVGSGTVDVVTLAGNGDGIADNGGFSVTSTGLPAVGDVLYALDNTNDPDIWQIVPIDNPAIGVIASGVSLTQSLIGSVVNRPSSPFVAGLAVPGDDPCGAGAWGRVVGGTADVTGQTTAQTGAGDFTFSSDITADYYGVQLGGDFSCFDNRYNGWNLTFGGILGVNLGSTQQPVLAFNPNTGETIPGTDIASISSDFVQSYVGAYVAASKDRLFADLQYRIERTDFDIEEVAVDPDNAVGLDEQSFSSDAQTLSGSVGYVIPINEEERLNFIPSAGFAYTWTNTDEITFENGAETLTIEDSTTQVGFVSGTLSKTQINPDGRSALNYFGTATIYSDFAPATTSVYSGTGDESTASNLGTYGEVSVGLNYTRILEPGDIGAGRQLNASVRVDGRFSDTVESYGVTGQVRLQF